MYIFNESNNPLKLSETQLQQIQNLSKEQCNVAEAMADLVGAFQTQEIIDKWWDEDSQTVKEKTFVVRLSKFDYLNNLTARIQLAYLLVGRMKVWSIMSNNTESNLFDDFYRHINRSLLKDNTFIITDYFRTHVFSDFEYKDLKGDSWEVQDVVGSKNIEPTLRTLLTHLFMHIKSVDFSIARKKYSTFMNYKSLDELSDTARLVYGEQDYWKVMNSLDYIRWSIHDRNTFEHNNTADDNASSKQRICFLVKFVISAFTAAALEVKCEKAEYGVFFKSDLKNITVEAENTNHKTKSGDSGFRRALALSKSGTYTIKATAPDGRVLKRITSVSKGSFLDSENCLVFNFGANQQSDTSTSQGQSQTNEIIDEIQKLTFEERKIQQIRELKDGSEAFSRKDYKEALRRYAKAKELLPNSLVWAMLGSVYYHQENQDKEMAIRCLNQATSSVWESEIAPHAYLLRAYINFFDCEKRFDKNGNDSEWNPVRLDLEKYLNCKEKLKTEFEIPIEPLDHWFYFLPECKTPEDIVNAIESLMKEAPQKSRLQKLIYEKEKEAVECERYSIMVIAFILSITMAVLWTWEDLNKWWTIGGCVLLASITGRCAFIQSTNQGIRRIPQKIDKRNGKYIVKGLTKFNPICVLLNALFYGGLPLVFSVLISRLLELPDTNAFFAMLRLVGRLMLPATVVIAVLAVINLLLRFYEIINGPFSLDSFIAKRLRPMLPFMRSDITKVGTFVGDAVAKLLKLIALAFIIALLWFIATLCVDKKMWHQRYYYWPFRPDISVPIDSTVVNPLENVEQTMSNQQKQPHDGLPKSKPKGGHKKPKKTRGGKSPMKHVNLEKMYLQEEDRIITLQMGSRYQLHLIVEPNNHDEKIHIDAAKDPGGIEIIRVSQELIVTPIRRGTALVLLTSSRTHKKAQCQIEVR